ncbi:unnamed protein product [Cylindrotheca closterium]|uniref:DUF6824 domain-containing protein n=1 Tax=Cylindrotheca closterium TaxID=2856 RepID=A0AAD2FXN4_9STRA|nr:unnamed protein product [Cylindrotheca closterium]
MASSIQHHNWSCRPCKGGHQHDDTDHNTAPITTNRQAANHDGLHVMQPTEEMLASELNKLSLEERAEAFDDIHCVGEELKETPGMIQKALADFEEMVKKDRNAAYEIAMTQNRAYVEDPSFRLKFLRANMHDVGKSVRQMMNSLQHKAKYFGNDKVAREITLDDLNEEDKNLLLSGFYHVQEERDRTGRAILHWFGGMLGRIKPENLIRVAYFVWISILLPDPVVQTKGLVTVYHNASRTGKEFVMPGMNFIMTVSNATASFPVRFSSMHYCLQTTEANLALNNSFLGPIVNTLPLYSKVRSRFHVGSIIEIQYALRGHGIPTDTLPVDMNGNIREDICLAWFYNHQREQAENNCSIVRAPGSTKEDKALFSSSLRTAQTRQVARGNRHVPFDVNPSAKPTEADILLGRGRVAQSWPGNSNFRRFLEKHSAEYDMLPRNERKRRTIELTQELGTKGIRFFEETESGEWAKIECSEARKKVSQLLRTLRKKK